MPIKSFAKTASAFYCSTQKKSEEHSKGLHTEDQESPSNNKESKDENDNFSLKIFIGTEKSWIIYKQVEIKYILYNTQHSMQFLPEFYTPPPKQFVA